jgi:hypothetical protein
LEKVLTLPRFFKEDRRRFFSTAIKIFFSNGRKTDRTDENKQGKLQRINSKDSVVGAFLDALNNCQTDYLRVEL